MDVKEYYDSCFPFRQLFLWLNHSPKSGNDFTHREFAFTITNGSGSDIYVRYQSFPTIDAFKKKVKLLIPKRFEIGAVYTACPAEHKLISAEKYTAVAKEFVLDIDLSDYDPVRTCCKGKQVCIKCWQYIVAAIDVLKEALETDMGYKHVLWVFSGRRGVHAWVCDPRARMLTDSQRESLLEFLNVTNKHIKGRTVIQRPFHPSVHRAFMTLAAKFDEVVLKGQDPWSGVEGGKRLLTLLAGSNEQLLKTLEARWAQESKENKSSRSKWLDIDSVARTVPKIDATKLLELKQNVILEYMYPRLDGAVSVSRQHLLKSPFCVHPNTGKICVPMNSTTYSSFDPDQVPTLETLAADTAELDPYVGVFKQFVHQLQLGETKKRVADTLDF